MAAALTAWRKAVSGVAVRKSVKSHSWKGFMTVLENGFHAVKSHNIMGQRGYLKALNAVDFGYPGTPGIFFCHIFLHSAPPPLKSHQPPFPPDLKKKKLTIPTRSQSNDWSSIGFD